jgi:mono/diheme cytochrome c family protein
MSRSPLTPAVVLLALFGCASVAALAMQAQPPAPVRRDFPARPPGDAEAIARGKALYGANCAFCHGADIRGGDSGPSLLRAGVVLDDREGELIGPIVRSGRPDRGMPRFAFTDDQLRDIAAFIHSFAAAGYDESRLKPPTILVGDAGAGEAYFGRTCAACHSISGDLQGLATRIDDPKLLQQTWLMPGSGGRAAAALQLRVPPATVTVTLASGATVEGVLDRIDDFGVALIDANGAYRSFPLGGSVVAEVHDPLQPHRDLLPKYSDADIHNVTAYLATVK